MVSPATTARIVAKATALMNAKKSGPPMVSASCGADMLSVGMLCGLRMVAAPKPRNVVRM